MSRWLRIASVFMLLFVPMCSPDAACAVGMNRVIFKNGLLNGVPDLDQSSVRFYDCNLKGLTDSAGKQILAPVYADIQYLGHGIFLATETDPDHKFYFGKKRHLFNRDGKELAFAVPDGAVLLNIFSFGARADDDTTLILHQLDANTVLLFGIPKDQEGLCDVRGTVTLPALPGEIRFVSSDSAYVEIPSNRYIIDLKTGEKTPTGSTAYNPGVFPQPRLSWTGSVRSTMIKLPDDRCITTRAHDDGLFDREYWLDYRDHPIARLGMFNRFLKQFDLIGMPKTQVVNILGEPVQCWLPGTPCLTENGQLLLSRPDLLIYAFPAIGCTPSFFGVKIYFKDDKVERWCFARDSKDSEPVTTNVVLDWSKRTDDGRLLGARIGSGEDFPPFLAKVRKRSKR